MNRISGMKSGQRNPDDITVRCFFSFFHRVLYSTQHHSGIDNASQAQEINVTIENSEIFQEFKVLFFNMFVVNSIQSNTNYGSI